MSLQEQVTLGGFSEEVVTHAFEVDGQLVVVEQVPALVDRVTGERFFTGETVDRLREVVRRQRPIRVVETQVYGFAA